MAIRVLIVDDSAIVRDVLSVQLGRLSDIEVVGVAPDPFIARDRIVQLKPDVITLDIEMPRMDGLTFLERLMTYYPIPVIIVSSVTTADQSAAIRALELGAFDIVNKPGGAISVGESVEEIAFKIRQAYEARLLFLAKHQSAKVDRVSPQRTKDSTVLSSVKTTDKLVCLGASTGGTIALEFVLQNLVQFQLPILVVQHMPPFFTKQFADRLNKLCSMVVKEAEDGELVSNGTVYIAPGGSHLIVNRRGATIYLGLTTTERVNFQRPSVDVLFESAADVAGKNVVATVLTGMGKDGARGLLKLRKLGARTIAQDEASSVVWGMPKAAIDLDAAEEVLPLEKIPERLMTLSRQV